MTGIVKRFFGNKIFKKKITDIIKVGVGGTFAFIGINVYFQNEKFYDDWVMPLLHHLDPETSHSLAVLAAKYRIVPKYKLEESKLLEPPLTPPDVRPTNTPLEV